LVRDKLEVIANKLVAQEVAKLSTNRLVCDFCEQAHESHACLPASLGLSEEKVKYMGVY